MKQINVRLAKLRSRFPPPVILLIFVVGDCLTANPHFTFGLVSQVLSLAIAAVSLGVILTTAWHMHVSRTTLNPLQADKTTMLVTHGCYAWSRNPIYLGLTGVQLAVALWMGSLPGLIAVPFFMLAVARLHIDFEEFQLHKRFGAQWEHYAKQVRRWL
ncbi:isoprenylcysteine carboxylmethyltransferase family protein [Citrobacter amalonaticus]|uniref:methyltransferase family protein n=1 Tax=Citrobacter amalonaticus TaxID=35703 RepID=UPI00215BA7F9|nr:isoprenylcysteine carboxylmethyltransferase family protein [Citrobacter amalonaticus]MCR9029191.1 isoprenylcysteine carboxylmethyltransferase family protein [Citrobacter amalonaticus]